MRVTRLSWFRLSLLVSCATWSSLPLLAQAGAGEITGIVKDQAGAAVPRAMVTVTETRTNLRRIVVSGGEGVYTAASLAPGDYRVALGAYSKDHAFCYALTDLALSLSVRADYQIWGRFVHPCEWRIEMKAVRK